MELDAQAVRHGCRGGLNMAPTNKVHHVRTIARVAEMLGEDEDWLGNVANEMDQEDGLIWVYGPGDDGVMAFTDFGIETLTGLITRPILICSSGGPPTLSDTLRSTPHANEEDANSPYKCPKPIKRHRPDRGVPKTRAPRRRKPDYARYPNEKREAWESKARAENLARKSDAVEALCSALRGLGIEFRKERKFARSATHISSTFGARHCALHGNAMELGIMT